MLHPVSLKEIHEHSNFLQTGVWGEIKKEYSWRAYAFRFNKLSLLVLVRELPMGIRIAYVPRGPAARMDLPFFKNFAASICSQIPEKITFLRFDLPWETDGSEVLKRPFFKAPVEIQPPDTVILDISRDIDVILAQMKKKTRYNIRLAERKGVTVREVDDEILPSWYEIYQATAERDRISIHQLDYYLTVYKQFKASPVTEPLLLCAYIGNTLIAGIFVVLCGDTATYVYGASSNEHRNVMPNYLLQWKAIQIAKEKGCSKYDFFGIPPEDDPSHPMHGLYRFKTGFGGRIIHMAGCYDYPVNYVSYFMYRIFETFRNFYYKKIKKR